MVQKAKKPITTSDRFKSLNEHKSTLYGLGRYKQSPIISGTAFFANTGGAAGGSTAAAGNYLETQGDTMVGPIAFYPATVFVNASDELDISAGLTSTPQSSSYVIASFASPDTIQLIKGAQFAGQQLWLQVPAASTLTVEDYSSNVTGNIVTSDSSDLVITTTTDPVTFTLLFDVTLSPNGNTGGWVILNAKAVTGATGPGSFATKALNNLVAPTLNVAIDFNSKAPTNFNGYVSQIIGNTLVNDATGATWTLPASDLYTYNINGVSEFVISSVGVAVKNSITLDDTVADPTAAGEIQRNGADVKVFTGGAVVNLSDIGSGGTGAFATRQLDNLDTAVLNEAINFNSKAPTNFNGYTSQVVGNTLVNDTAGSTWTLPTGDAYLYNINGIEEFEVSTNNINVKDNGLTQWVGWTAGVGQTEVVDATGIALSLPLGDTWGVTIDGVAVAAITKSGWAFDAALATDTFNMNSHKIINLTDPTLAQDAATKAYVDASGGGGVSFPLDYPVDRQGNKTGTVTHDLSLTSAHKLVFTATGDCDITISNIPTTASDAQDFYIEVTQNGTGGHDITFNDAEVINPPTLSTTADTTSLLACHADGDGNIRIITLLNAAPTSGNFATKALDNLVSPVLGTSIDFNSNAPTNFNGYTSQIVGNTLVNDATGATWTLPTGDAYDYKINGVSIVNITSVGIGMGATGAGAINMADNYITMDDISTPANPGVGQRRIFVDTATGELSVRTTGGTTVSLEAAASAPDKISEGDSSVEVVDTGTGSIAFVVDTVAMGTITNGVGWSIDKNVSINSTNTLTVGGATTLNGNMDFGNATTDTITVTGRIDSDVAPIDNGVRTLGTSSLHWDDVFTESLTLRGTGATTSNTVPWISADASSMIFNVPSADGWIFKDNGVTDIQITEDSGTTDYFIRAGAAKKMGFVVDSSTVSVGSSGTIQIPVDTGSVGTAAAADTDFGDNVGCIGLYLNTIGSGNPTYCIKIDDGTGTDNRWAAIIINRTTGALSGSILT